MKATFTKTDHTGKIAQNRKEKHFSEQYSIVTFDGENMKNPITCRLYQTAGRAYCCVWAGNGNIRTSGGGIDNIIWECAGPELKALDDKIYALRQDYENQLKMGV